MANVVRSFRQGFQATNDVFDRANDIEDRKDALERRATLRNRQDTEWEQGQEDRAKQLKRNDITWDQDQADREREIKRQAEADKIAKETHSLNMRKGKKEIEGFDFNQKLKQRKIDGDTLNDQLLRAQASNNYDWFGSDEAQTIYDRNPALNPSWITDNETYNAAGRLTNILNGVANGQMPQWNDPDLVGDLNQLFPEITSSSDLPDRTKDGKKIVGRKIVGVVPLKGGKVAVQLEITDEDGKKYNAPVTEGRSSNDSENVMQIGLDQLSNRINLVRQGQQDEIFKTTGDYIRSLSGSSSKGSSKTANDMRKELFKAENDIRSAAEKQRAAVMNDPTITDDQIRQQRIEQINESERRQLSQTRLSIQNLYGGSFDANLEGNQRNKQITNNLQQFKEANPNVQWSPELDAVVRESIEAGDKPEFTQQLISRNAQNSGSPSSQPESKSEVASLFDRFTGGGEPEPEADQQELANVTQQINQEGLSLGQIEQIINSSNLPKDVKSKLYNEAAYGVNTNDLSGGEVGKRANESTARQQAAPMPVGLAQRMSSVQRG